jgi:multimeric flavodoxin WrbA
MSKTIIAIVGTYRKGHTIDQAVDEIICGAKEKGATVKKIYLLDKHIEFCTNCRLCNEKEGSKRGKCVHKDDMDAILTEIDNADALVLAAPVNFFNVNAITRRFMERLVCYAYWPWGTKGGPVARTKHLNKKALLVTSTAMPGFLIPMFTGAVRALKAAAKVMGAKTVGVLCIGFSAVEQKQTLPESVKRKAKELGTKLA